MRTQHLSKTGAGTQWRFIGSGRGHRMGGKTVCLLHSWSCRRDILSSVGSINEEHMPGPYQLGEVWVSSSLPQTTLADSLQQQPGVGGAGVGCPLTSKRPHGVLRSPPHSTPPALWVYASTGPWGNFHFCPVADFSISH